MSWLIITIATAVALMILASAIIPDEPQKRCGYYVNGTCSHKDGPYCTVKHCDTLRRIVEHQRNG